MLFSLEMIKPFLPEKIANHEHVQLAGKPAAHFKAVRVDPAPTAHARVCDQSPCLSASCTAVFTPPPPLPPVPLGVSTHNGTNQPSTHRSTLVTRNGCGSQPILRAFVCLPTYVACRRSPRS